MCDKIISNFKMWSCTHNKSRTLEFHSHLTTRANHSQTLLTKLKRRKYLPTYFKDWYCLSTRSDKDSTIMEKEASVSSRSIETKIILNSIGEWGLDGFPCCDQMFWWERPTGERVNSDSQFKHNPSWWRRHLATAL